MKQLRKMGNYNSYLAILSALDSGPLRRLDWTKSLKDQLAEHAEVMESSHSFRNYRKLLSETAPPCLPYVGLILQDLTFVHVGNPDRSFSNSETKNGSTEKGKNLINYGKRWQQFAILDNIRRFKTWPYDIQRDDKVLRVFDDFSNYLQEEETWTRFQRSAPIHPQPEFVRTSNGTTIFPLRIESLSPTTIEKVFEKGTVPSLQQRRSPFARHFSATLQNYECKYIVLKFTTCCIISIPIIIIWCCLFLFG
uniref:Ras-GEF domain-containing protein n=1 Tax=Ditylenchus dipsaci TaxID=166011 RepID=A0A915CN79_9BILA